MIPKELLFEVINSTVTGEQVTPDDLDDIINEFVELYTLYEHGSIENYEKYINETYGDILTKARNVLSRKENA